ncbi:MFS transporter [Massilia arenosa]|uniref:MFS transporter n=1 Tax=Zemynaea arenosa TaxID=2561931 RepID=A0A4Y9SBQ0_9BURK|nr:MFS transporter [Massilia arenosa]TFW18050.1 MFS transporter [Massilia arenosa]
MSRYEARELLPHEKPVIPGSPATPDHPLRDRVLFFLVGVVINITGALGNALVSVNLINLQGTLGAFTTEIAWLPAAYAMTNVSMNLLLVKFRQQFGLRLFTEGFLVLYALTTFAHLFVNDLRSAIAIRAVAGVVGAALTTLGLYYTLQAFKREWRIKGIAISLGCSQLGIPIAYLFSNELLQLGEWRGLYLFELGLALVSLACVIGLPLPPSERMKSFEKMDFVTFALFAPGAALLCAAVSLGRVQWWYEQAWIGWALVGAIILLTAAMAIEHYRARPLLNLRWLASGSLLRLFLVMALVRLVLSEQGVGAVNFMRGLGMNNEQLTTLFIVVVSATVLAIVFSALTLNPQHLHEPVIVALLIMATGAFMDANSTTLTRPEQMYVSQFLLAFGGVMFMGPSVVFGMGKVLANPKNIVSFAVMLGLSQTMGGLLGAAALGTLQTAREKYHSSVLVEHLSLMDPQVAARVQQYAGAYGRTTVDPSLRNVEGLATLSQVTAREANVLAYNDVFTVIGVVAVLTALYVFAIYLYRQLQPPPPVAPSAASSSPVKT